MVSMLATSSPTRGCLLRNPTTRPLFTAAHTMLALDDGRLATPFEPSGAVTTVFDPSGRRVGGLVHGYGWPSVPKHEARIPAIPICAGGPLQFVRIRCP